MLAVAVCSRHSWGETRLPLEKKTLVACRGIWQMEGGRGWVLGEAFSAGLKPIIPIPGTLRWPKGGGGAAGREPNWEPDPCGEPSPALHVSLLLKGALEACFLVCEALCSPLLHMGMMPTLGGCPSPMSTLRSEPVLHIPMRQHRPKSRLHAGGQRHELQDHLLVFPPLPCPQPSVCRLGPAQRLSHLE